MTVVPLREMGLQVALLDREELLARTDLVELITEICGGPQGRGPSARWHCPNPDHPDAHPSMGVYSRGSVRRWKCHACGEGGTAIDLLMISGSVSAGVAMQDLARRLGIDQDAESSFGRPRHPSAIRPAPARRQETILTVASGAAIEEFVASAENLLWQSGGGFAQRKLAERGFSEELLRVNRVGFDPGPAALSRPNGLPRRSPGIVFPVLDQETGKAVYYQVRSLSPRDATAGRKYDQPTAQVAPNPKVTAVRLARSAATDWVALAEGIPDALTAAQAGVKAVAILGVAHASADNVQDLVERILKDFPAPGFVVCFDPDRAGLAAGNRLADRLARDSAQVARVLPPGGHRDLNAWWQADPAAVTSQLVGAALSI